MTEVLKTPYTGPGEPRGKHLDEVIIGYNCKVCRGRNFRESGEVITHICAGVAMPVYGKKT